MIVYKATNINTNEIFDTMKEAAVKCNVCIDSIRQVCKGEKRLC